MSLLITTAANDSWGTFISSILPWATFLGLGWKLIDSAFKFLGRRTKEVILEAVKAYVTPLMDMIDVRFEGIKKEHSEIKKQLEEIKKKQ